MKKIKYFILVPDGMADERIPALNNKSPLESAKIENFNFFLKQGIAGFVRTIPPSIKEPGSDAANLSILGYNPEQYKNLGRGPLEALSIGLNLEDSDLIFRANCVTIKNNVMISSNSNHIKSELSFKFIEYINEHLNIPGIEFYKGVGFRHILRIDTKLNPEIDISKLQCTPPHNIVDSQIDEYLPKGRGAEFLINLMNRIEELLKNCDLNNDLKFPVTTMWLWGGGKKIFLKNFEEIWGIKGAMISAVDLLNGIAFGIGFDILKVSGATGYYDSNFLNKSKTAIENIWKYDLIYLHTEAPDEAGHDKNYFKKIEMIEKFDREILEPIKKFYLQNSDNLRILILPDHPTPVRLGYHTNDAVPFIICGAGINSGQNDVFSEFIKPDFTFNSGTELLRYFLNV